MGSKDKHSILLSLTAKDSRITTRQALIDSGEIQLHAVVSSSGRLTSLNATIWAETIEQAREIAAKFPKSLRLRTGTCTGQDYYDHQVIDPRYRAGYHHPDGIWSHGWSTGLVSLVVSFRADGVNKGANETGLKRYRSFRKHTDKLGIKVTFVGGLYQNSVPTEDALNALLEEVA
jgi:hypothetical protein